MNETGSFKNVLSILKVLETKPFSSWTYEEKCSVKNSRFTPNLDVKCVDGNASRYFRSLWYTRYSWLTGCAATNKLFCYTCVLFGGEKEWALHGITITKNFLRKADKHNNSNKHIQNEESFRLLGRGRIEHVLSQGARIQAIKHNEVVKQNRLVIERLIDIACFLGKQELSFQGHFEGEDSVNRGNYLELLDVVSKQEQYIHDHLQSTSGITGTSHDIQNELIESVTDIIKEKIMEELAFCEFIGIQADETLDVSNKSQVSIIFRFCSKEGAVERFMGFYEVSVNKTASSLSELIFNVLQKCGVTDKVVSQTYDGSCVMAGMHGGVQYHIKQTSPRALFLHCYAHKLNLLLLHCCKTIRLVRHFIHNLTAFHSFFSRSSKRTQVLTSKGFIVPESSTTHCNFHSRAVDTIFSNYDALREVFEDFTELGEDWDSESYNSAVGLLNILKNTHFSFLLCLYKAIFTHTDHLFALLQQKTVSDVLLCSNEIKKTIATLREMRSSDNIVSSCIEKCRLINNESNIDDEMFKSLKQLTYEVLDTVITQMEERFDDLESIEFVELLDKDHFVAYQLSFPHIKLNSLLNKYPIFNKERLENELKNIYSDADKHLSPQKLQEFILINDLEPVYSEVCRLIRLILTFPVTDVSSERGTSTLKRVKAYLRNTVVNKRLSTIAIEKELVKELMSDQLLKDRVIDNFANKKTQSLELLYKKI